MIRYTINIFCAALWLLWGSQSLAATIDIMVVYDTTAKNWVDDNGGMDIFASNTVAKMNMALANSGINELSFRLVHVEESPYTSTSDGSTPLSDDLDALQNGAGGLSNIPTLRDSYHADLVTMLVDTGQDYGNVGTGKLLTSISGDPTSAYSVCAIQAVAIDHTLTHEVGHNLGADHSKNQAEAWGPNSAIGEYAAGWYFSGADSVDYHTLMSYNEDGYGNSYQEAPYFSTPLVTYQETTVGDAIDGDNARVIGETMDAVAGYRIANGGLDSGSWPMFRQNTFHTGQSSFNGPENPALKWRYQTGDNIHSSPAIDADGTVYVKSFDNYLYAINSDGTLKWQYDPGGSGDSFSSPAIGFDGTVYVGSGAYLYAINQDGTLKWRYATGHYVRSCPAISLDGTIYVGSGDGYLYVINPDGTLKWRYQTGGYVYSSPAIGADGTVYVGSFDNYLYAINPDGTLKWRYQTGGYVFSSPAIGTDDTVYFGSGDNYLYALAPDGTLKWRYQTGGIILFSSPAIGFDGTVYVGSEDKYTYAINSDGTFKWRYLTGGGLTSDSSPAIGLDGTVYVGSGDGYLYVLNPDGTLKWRYQTDNLIRSSVAIGADGTVYVGSYDTYLYAITEFSGIKGTISDTTTNTPILNVTISIPTGESSLSDINGSYQLPLSAGVYSFTFSHPSYQATTIDNVLVHEGQATELNATLFKSLSGAVRDISTNAPISGVTISTNTGVNTVSNQQGDYGFTYLSPGMYSITFSHPSYQTITINTVLVQDGQPTVQDGYLTIPSILNITSTSPLASAETGATYNERVKINGGTWPFTFSLIEGILPPGLSLDSAFGNITGTPTNAGSYTFSIGIQDALGVYAQRQFTIEVAEPLTIISPSALPRAIFNEFYSFSFETFGGSHPITYSYDGDLPFDLFFQSDGNIVGRATDIIDFESGYLSDLTGNWIMSGDVSILNYAVNYNVLHLGDATYNSSVEITADCSEGPVSFDFSEEYHSFWGGGFSFYIDDIYQNLPFSGHFYEGVTPGVHKFKWAFNVDYREDLNEGNYANIDNIHLPIDVLGQHIFTVTANDNSGRTETKEFVLSVDPPLSISTTELNNGIVGQSFTQQLSATGGYYGNYTWNVYAGSLPEGIILNSNGTLTGTPLQATNEIIVLSVTDDYGRPQFKDFNFLVVKPLTFATSSLPAAHTDTGYSEQIVTEGGVDPFIYSYEGQLPAGLTLNTSNGIITGTTTAADDTVNFLVNVIDSTWPINQSVSQVMSISTTSDLTITTSAVLPPWKKDKTISPVTLSAAGGYSPFSWTVVSGYIPAGVSLDSANGILSGTPLAGGDYIFALQVTDTTGATAEKEFFLSVYSDLEIITSVVKTGGVDIPYSDILKAKGGKKPYTWHLASDTGTLPTGLSFYSDGIIAGTPTARQSFQFTVEVSDAGGNHAQTVQRTYSIATYDELFIETSELLDSRIGEAYTATIEASLGKSPYSFRVSEGIMPPGLTFDSESGMISGTPTTPGDYPFTVEVTDTDTPIAIASKSYTVTIYGELTIETVGLNSAYKGESYLDSILVSGGALPYSWQIIEGNLPAGLSLNRTTGAITGTTELDEGESRTFTVKIIEGGEPKGEVEKEFVIYVITPIAIETEIIHDAMQNLAYSVNLTGIGGILPYTWSLEAGSLPNGVTIDTTTGVISGIPTNCGPFDFTVNLSDSVQLPNTSYRAYHIDVVCENQTDYDQDGMTNDFEITYGLNEYDNTDASQDADGDGLSNLSEYMHGTDPFNSDSDNDGILDGNEDLNDNGIVDSGETDPSVFDIDSDQDGVADIIDNCPAASNNNQSDVDADDKGDLCDNCPVDYNPDQADADTPEDGIGNICDDGDADGDGFSDREETVCGSDPANINLRCSVGLHFLMLLLGD